MDARPRGPITSPAANTPGRGGRVPVVHPDPAGGVDLDSGFRESQALDLRAPACGDQDLLGPERAAVGEPGLERAALARDAGHRDHGDHADPHGVEGLGEDPRHLDIERREQVVAGVHDGHLHAEPGEDRRVLAACGATADDEDRLRRSPRSPRMLSESCTSGSSMGIPGG